ncbi:MAG TPA: tetratricopeptide repeat protein, partial [Bacteroidia bacterium]|jgi:serine phosphatase RsbU (regulator of sigma subunit)|nr:tetratricopeptide repeat protein [Bacteroidia bacterium]
MKNYNKAILDFQKSYSVAKDVNYVGNEASCLNNLSNVYGDLGKRDSVYILLNQALELYKQGNDKFCEGKILNNLGTAYLDDSVLDKAENYFTQALDIRQQVGDKRGQAITLTNLGALECSRLNWDKALDYFNKAMELAKNAQSSDIMIALYQNIAEVYSNKKDFEKALDYKNGEVDLKDSIFDKNLSENIAEMQAKYDVEKAESETRTQQKEKKLITSGAIIGGILLIIILFFFVNRAMVRKRTNVKLNAQKEEIEVKNKEIEVKNKDITDSILYASRIQEAILPEVEFFNTFLEKGFVFYRPKDIVSGDFYWMAQTPEHLLFAAVDCTGHGVPGAFMSIVCSNLLTQAVKEHGLTKPNEILNDVNIRLSETLRQRQDESRVRDGMDIALCSIHKKTKVLSFAGAYNPVFIIRKKQLTELLPDKFPVGLFVEEELKKFTHKEMQLEKGDRIYVASDGYADQFGGPLGKKFKKSSFVELLLSIQDHSIREQKNLLKKAHLDWKGSYEQIDDVLVMGVEVA